MGIVTICTCELFLIETVPGQPFSPADTMGVFLPVVVDQSMTFCADFFRCLGHDAAAIIFSIFIPVIYQMAVIAAVIFSMI